MSQPIRGQGGHFVFPIGPKNTNLVEGVKILLPVKFRWILFSGFREEVENVSANQRPGRPFCFSDRLEKHKLGRGRWDLASCQVSLNSVQRFQRRSRKCESLRQTTDGRTTDGRTDDGRCAMTIAHSSLWWAKNYWPVSSALLTGHMTNDVTKRQMSWPQRRALAFCWQCFCDLKQLPIGNKTVISRLLGKQSNHCPSVVEKILETVALGLQPLATVSQIFSTTEGQWFDCSPHSHEITVYCPLRTYCLLEFFLLVNWPMSTLCPLCIDEAKFCMVILKVNNSFLIILMKF